jgi:hypothetical protein
MDVYGLLTLLFSGLAAIGSLTGVVILWRSRKRIVLELRQKGEDVLSFHIINETNRVIELQEYGFHLDNGEDLSRSANLESVSNNVLISFRSLLPGKDFISEWSLSGIKKDILAKSKRSHIQFTYASDSKVKKYTFQGKIPYQIKKLLNC